MESPKVFADFHNADAQGRLRLNCVGTLNDLSEQQISLSEGIKLSLYSENLCVTGTVKYSSEEAIWVAAIDWDAIHETEDSYHAARSVTAPQRRIA